MATNSKRRKAKRLVYNLLTELGEDTSIIKQAEHLIRYDVQADEVVVVAPAVQKVYHLHPSEQKEFIKQYLINF